MLWRKTLHKLLYCFVVRASFHASAETSLPASASNCFPITTGFGSLRGSLGEFTAANSELHGDIQPKKKQKTRGNVLQCPESGVAHMLVVTMVTETASERTRTFHQVPVISFFHNRCKRSAPMSSLLEQRITSVSCQFPDLWQSWRYGDRNRQKTANLSRYAVAHVPRRSAWIPARVAAQSLGDLADLHLVLPSTLRDNRHRAPVNWCELEMNFCRV